MTLKPSKLYAVGQTYHDFKVTKAIEIPELHCFLRELVHVPTGAQVMHISNEDPENLFCLSFQTIPDSSNGVAHILEHTVLCGSKKYPVKDPFFAMTRRSLNTFMNALTGSDFTCYPAATQVSKDFYNILEVYLDAVFHPNLNRLSFLQEGHRLEFTIPNDPDSTLEFKGVVFNEMKGSMASPNSRMAEAMNKLLFPNITYGFNSGGDPLEIPKLSYEELCAFHLKYYQPSHCLFFFYGNMPLEGHLDFISKHALDDAKKIEPLSAIPPQPRYLKPQQQLMQYPVAADESSEDKSFVAFGWLTCNILEQETALALNVLELILMDNDASPLKLAFLRSGLCKQASIYSDFEVSEVPIIIILGGCNSDDAEKLEAVLRNTLKEVIKNGIPLEMVENVMHQLEFHRSEIGGNHSPFGLSLFMRSALLKQHNGDSESGLTIHAHFDQLHKRNLEDPTYLTGLLQKYFLDNTHFVRMTMQPDKDLAAKEIAEEKEILQKIRSKLSTGEIKEIVKKSVELAEFQKQQEEEADFDVLPKISLEDVPKGSKRYPLQQEKLGNLEVFHHNAFTNKIVYADLVFDLPSITREEIPLLRLLSVLMTQMGSGNRNYADTLEYIQANTGGIGAYPTLYHQASNHSQYAPSFGIRGKALYRKASKLFSLLIDVATSVDLKDLERLKEIVLKHYTSLQTATISNSMKYAVGLASSALESASAISNHWYGLCYFIAIKEIANDIDNQLEPLSQKLQSLQKRLKGINNPHLVITCDSEMYNELKGHKFYGLQDIGTKTYTPWKGEMSTMDIVSQGRVISSPVAFTGHVFPTFSYTHPDAPALALASSLFDNLVLHPLVREQGGAYGSGAVSNPMSGNFYFYAYRDPNISSTLEAFSKAANAIAIDEDFTDLDLEESKLEIIQSLDSPVAPGSRGEVAYTWMREGREPEVRQAFRNRLLELKREDIIKAIKQHILPKIDAGITVVFAGKELLDKENATREALGLKPFAIESL
jgi:Zn-dependent M16 (insulinase) family peptidase